MCYKCSDYHYCYDCYCSPRRRRGGAGGGPPLPTPLLPWRGAARGAGWGLEYPDLLGGIWASDWASELTSP